MTDETPTRAIWRLVGRAVAPMVTWGGIVPAWTWALSMLGVEPRLAFGTAIAGAFVLLLPLGAMAWGAALGSWWVTSTKALDLVELNKTFEGLIERAEKATEAMRKARAVR